MEREPYTTPSVIDLLRRAPGGFVGPTLLIGLGVVTVWCFGLGVLFLWLGSSTLLAHAARTAGCETPQTRLRLYGGGVAVMLASVLAIAGYIGGFVVSSTQPVLAFVSAACCAAVMGAALAPLAFAPIASACGTRGALAPFVRATDLAGSDRLVVLAPLSSLIAVSLVMPIPLVAVGVTGVFQANALYWATGALGLVVWMLAVPASAAALTLRYLRLLQGNDEPARLGQALAPVFGAVAIGLVALLSSLVVAGATPTAVRSSVLERPSMSGEPLASDRMLMARISAYDVERLPYEARIRAACVERGVVVRCEDAERRVWFELDAAMSPIEAPLAHRVAVRLGVSGAIAIALALLIVAFALAWLGRIGASLRLLARAPFALRGALEMSEGALVFESTDGAHRVRPRSSCVVAPPEWTPSGPEPAVVLSQTPIEPISFRTGHAELPRGALLVVGTRESALGRALARGRRIGFRLAALALAALVGASAGILVAL